jgi:hypothetical protein
MKSFTLLLTVFYCFNLQSLDAQDSAKRKLDPFTSIHVQGDVVIELEQGDEEYVEIRRAEGVELENITTEVKGTELKIRSKIDLSNNKKVFILIKYKTLHELTAIADAEINSKSEIKDSIKFILNSGSKAEFTADAKKIEASVSSGGLLVLKGTVDYLNCTASAGATVSAFELEVKNAKCNANTGGIVKVHAKDKLEANANTKGYINYTGDPEEKDIKTSLGGKVISED